MEHQASKAVSSCIFCGGRANLRQVIAGEAVAVCPVCASAGRTALDAGTMQSALRCLHLVAVEIERALEGAAEISRYRRALSRVRSALSSGDFVACCPCSRCTRKQVDADLDLHQFHIVDGFRLRKEPGVVVFTDLDDLPKSGEIPFRVLAAMPERARVVAPGKPWWRAIHEMELLKQRNAQETALPVEWVHDRVKAAQAVPEGRWRRVGECFSDLGYLPIDRAADYRDDAAARRYWAACQVHGPGYFDGRFYVDADGVCHEWPE